MPRALNKIYAAIAAQASAPGLKGKLLRHAIDTKIANFRATGAVTHPVYDRLVFSKVQKIMGGRLLYHTSGSAPIAKEVFETLKVAFAVDSIEVRLNARTTGTVAAMVADACCLLTHLLRSGLGHDRGALPSSSP